MKTKYFLAFVLVFTFIISCNFNVTAEEIPNSGFSVDARGAIIIEPTTGKVIFEQNVNEEFPLASVTKVMTMLLIYEAVDSGKINWDDTVTISDYAASMGGSQIFLEPTEQQTVRELTKAISVASANDASVAMAEFIAGSEEAFVTLMNQRAEELGMDNTYFKNACGLDIEGHYSSAYDIALMSKELTVNHPEVFEFTGIWMDSITHKTARGEEEFGLANTNKLIKSYNGATGLKTGSTSEALYCISATATRDNMDLIAVVLGAPDPKVRFQEAMKMLDYGFSTYTVVLGEETGTEKGTIKVVKGNADEVAIVVKQQIKCLVPKQKDINLESKLEIMETINAPVEKGTKVGEVVYYLGEEEVGRTDVVTADSVEKATLKDNVDWLMKEWLK